MLRKVLPQFFLSQSSISVVICSDKNIQDQRVNAPFFLEFRVYLTQARNSGPFDFLCINLYNNYIPFSFFLTRLSSSFFHSTTALHRAFGAVPRLNPYHFTLNPPIMDVFKSLIQPLVGGTAGSSVVDGMKLVVLGGTVETARRVSSSAWYLTLSLIYFTLFLISFSRSHFVNCKPNILPIGPPTNLSLSSILSHSPF